MRLCYYNRADEATLTSVTAHADYPVAYLQYAERGKEFRTTSAAASREIRFVFDAATSVSMIALCGHNLTDSATWTLTLYSDNAFTTSIETSGSLDAFAASALGATALVDSADTLRRLKNSVYYLTQTRANVLSGKIVISDTSNPDGYIAAQRLFVGTYVQPGRDAAFGAAAQWADDAEQVRMDGGSLRSITRIGSFRKWRASMRYFEPADRLIWSDVFRYTGSRRDFWLDVYPADTTSLGLDHRGQFKFSATGQVTHDQPTKWSTEYSLEEA